VRILFLLPDFPYPASTGGRLKVFNILKYVSRNNRCDILCFGQINELELTGLAASLPAVQVLRVFPPVTGIRKLWAGVGAVLQGLPPSFATFSRPEYQVFLQEVLKKNAYDIVHYDIINMAQHLPLGGHRASCHSPNDATSLVYFRMAERLGWSFQKLRLLLSAILLRRFERKTYPMFDKIHVVSNEDAAYLSSLDKRIDVTVIPIAVDGSFSPSVDSMKQRRDIQKKPARIICTGNFDNSAIAAGIDQFVRCAMPAIVKALPGTQLVILGKNVDDRLKQHYARLPGVQVLTWVENYLEFLSTADVVLVPDEVGPDGAKTRTLEAMSLKLPVIGTRTAFAGIPVIHREHGLIYGDMPECIEMMLAVLRDENLKDGIGEKASQLVTENFSLDAVGPRYEKLYRAAIVKFKMKSGAENG
jgi:glycosyltransferase involved in cell wall biosynthesis